MWQTISWIVIFRQTSLGRSLSQTSPASTLATVGSIYPLSWNSIIVKLWLIPSQIARIRILCLTRFINSNYLKGHSYTVIRGSVYTSKAYYQACTEKGITRSMSRKGTPAANAYIEWFHFVLKSETFYLHKWRNLTKDSITEIVKNYIIFYNETRIQQRLNDQSPVEYRKLVA